MADNWAGQQIPYSQEAEEAALGAALSAPQHAEGILTAAPPGDYFILRNQYMAQAIQRCLDNQQPVDYLLVLNALTEMGKLGEIGGPSYLTQLINAAPASYNGVAYAKLVGLQATRRRVLAAGDEWKAWALNQEKSVEEVLGYAEKTLNDLAETTPLERVFPIRQAANQVLDNMEARMAAREAGQSLLAGLPTGFMGLNILLNGFRRKKLIVVGGRPGMGKSALLLFFAMQVATLPPKPDDTPHRVYLWSGEMDEEEIAERILAGRSGVDADKIINGSVNANDFSRVLNAAGGLSELVFHIDTTLRMTPRKLRRNIRRWARQVGGLPDMVFIDYEQLMYADDPAANKDTVEKLRNISRGLKELARELDCPIMPAAQLNRGVESRDDKRPMLSDFEGSGALEQDADIVLFPFFEAYYGDVNIKAGKLELICPKHRGGKTGTVDLWADFNRMSYVEEGFSAALDRMKV